MERQIPAEGDQPSSVVTIPGSIFRLFKNSRELPELPKNYLWDKQKQDYSPRNLLTKSNFWGFRPEHEFGYVFCHRGLYERSKRILDNSNAAIQNGIREGLFLQELDGFIAEKMDQAWLAHDQDPWRVTKKTDRWKSYSFRDILRTPLVSRNVDHPAMEDFASSYLDVHEKVPALLGTLWNETIQPAGTTIQFDLRDEDFAKAFSYYSFHMSKNRNQYISARGADETLVAKLFRSTMLKGYNKYYQSFSDLHKAISKESIRVYNADFFEVRHLPLFPPLIMVFSLKYIRDSAAEAECAGPESNKESYEHIYDTAWRDISSFVDVEGTGYNFILEVGFSGLGLGYDRVTKTAYNPRNGVKLEDPGVIFEALIDRVMIDVSLELRERNTNLIFSSCTRLPDIITPEGRFKVGHLDGKMALWDSDKKENTIELPNENGRITTQTRPLSEQEIRFQKEKGLSAELRTIHGGLYPQSHIVVADDPGAEIAARTWIDQYAEADRSQLLRRPGANNDEWTCFDVWISQVGNKMKKEERKDFLRAMEQVQGDFAPNKTGEKIEHLYIIPDRGDDIIPNHGINPASGTQVWLNHPDVRPLEKSLTFGTIDRRNREVVDPPADPLNISSVEVEGIAYKDADQIKIFGIGHLEPGAVVKFQGKKFEFQNVADAKRALATDRAYQAASRGLEEELRSALGEGADVNARTGFYGTPLIVACLNGYHTIVRLLLENGVDVNACEGSFFTPLAAACSNGDHTIVRLLLENKADMNARGTAGTPWEIASSYGHIRVVKGMTEHPAYATVPKLAMSQALRVSCARGHINIALHLLANGADVNFHATTMNQQLPRMGHATALQEACANGHISLVNILLDKEARIEDICDFSGKTALALASEGGFLDIVKLLVDKKAGLDHPGDSSKSALHLACQDGSEKCAQVAMYLINRGAEVNTMDNTSTSALHWACLYGQLPVVRLLLQKRATIHFPYTGQRFDTELQSILQEAGAVSRKQRDTFKLPVTSKSLGLYYSDKKPLHKEPIRTRTISYDDRKIKRSWGSQLSYSDRLKPELRSCGCLVCFIDEKSQPTKNRLSRGSFVVVHDRDPVRYSLDKLRIQEQKRLEGIQEQGKVLGLQEQRRLAEIQEQRRLAESQEQIRSATIEGRLILRQITRDIVKAREMRVWKRDMEGLSEMERVREREMERVRERVRERERVRVRESEREREREMERERERESEG
ncbi:unnamed protein product [Alternaria alternata]